MLVLTRGIDEEIVIGDNIRVRVVAVEGQRVRLGIMAPRCVNVARLELLTQFPAESASPTAQRNGKTSD